MHPNSRNYASRIKGLLIKEKHVLNSEGERNNIFEDLTWLQEDHNPNLLSLLGNWQGTIIIPTRFP
jgi:hypothetical protein